MIQQASPGSIALWKSWV